MPTPQGVASAMERKTDNGGRADCYYVEGDGEAPHAGWHLSGPRRNLPAMERVSMSRAPK